MKSTISVRALIALSLFASAVPSICRAEPFEDYPGQRAYIEDVRKMGAIRMQWEMTKRTYTFGDACGSAALAQAAFVALYGPATASTAVLGTEVESIYDVAKVAAGRGLAGGPLKTTRQILKDQFRTVFKDLPSALFAKGSACQQQFDKFIDVLAEDAERGYRGGEKVLRAIASAVKKPIGPIVLAGAKSVEEAAAKAAHEAK